MKLYVDLYLIDESPGWSYIPIFTPDTFTASDEKLELVPLEIYDLRSK